MGGETVCENSLSFFWPKLLVISEASERIWYFCNWKIICIFKLCFYAQKRLLEKVAFSSYIEYSYNFHNLSWKSSGRMVISLFVDYVQAKRNWFGRIGSFFFGWFVNKTVAIVKLLLVTKNNLENILRLSINPLSSLM